MTISRYKLVKLTIRQFPGMITSLSMILVAEQQVVSDRLSFGLPLRAITTASATTPGQVTRLNDLFFPAITLAEPVGMMITTIATIGNLGNDKMTVSLTSKIYES
jgi:hypothetical protein